MIDIAESISTFPPHQASPVSQPDQLQVILDRLQALEERVATQDEEIASLKATVTAQAAEIAALKENWKEARPLSTVTRLDDLWAWVEEIDSRTLSQPEPQPAKPSPHIDELYSHMKLVGLKQTTFAGAAKVLGVTKQRVLQLKPAIAQDMRFIILPSQSHSQKLIIRLRECQEL
jgi:hypothetical protein